MMGIEELMCTIYAADRNTVVRELMLSLLVVMFAVVSLALIRAFADEDDFQEIRRSDQRHMMERDNDEMRRHDYVARNNGGQGGYYNSQQPRQQSEFASSSSYPHASNQVSQQSRRDTSPASFQYQSHQQQQQQQQHQVNSYPQQVSQQSGHPKSASHHHSQHNKSSGHHPGSGLATAPHLASNSTSNVKSHGSMKGHGSHQSSQRSDHGRESPVISGHAHASHYSTATSDVHPRKSPSGGTTFNSLSTSGPGMRNGASSVPTHSGHNDRSQSTHLGHAHSGKSQPSHHSGHASNDASVSHHGSRGHHQSAVVPSESRSPSPNPANIPKPWTGSASGSQMSVGSAFDNNFPLPDDDVVVEETTETWKRTVTSVSHSNLNGLASQSTALKNDGSDSSIATNSSDSESSVGGHSRAGSEVDKRMSGTSINSYKK